MSAYYDLMGLDAISAERTRQMQQEGYTAGHDDEHKHNELVLAAECYLAAAVVSDRNGGLPVMRPPMKWPWAMDEWHPKPTAVENLAIAGALVAAEIDRIERSKRGLNGRMTAAEAIVVDHQELERDLDGA